MLAIVFSRLNRAGHTGWGSQTGSQRRQAPGDTTRPLATVPAVERLVGRRHATCRDPWTVPSKQRVAGSDLDQAALSSAGVATRTLGWPAFERPSFSSGYGFTIQCFLVTVRIRGSRKRCGHGHGRGRAWRRGTGCGRRYSGNARGGNGSASGSSANSSGPRPKRAVRRPRLSATKSGKLLPMNVNGRGFTSRTARPALPGAAPDWMVYAHSSTSGKIINFVLNGLNYGHPGVRQPAGFLRRLLRIAVG